MGGRRWCTAMRRLNAPTAAAGAGSWTDPRAGKRCRASSLLDKQSLKYPQSGRVGSLMGQWKRQLSAVECKYSCVKKAWGRGKLLLFSCLPYIRFLIFKNCGVFS